LVLGGEERPGVWEAPAFVATATAGFGEAPCSGLEAKQGGAAPAVKRPA
jgi:hypothetical protein